MERKIESHPLNFFVFFLQKVQMPQICDNLFFRMNRAPGEHLNIDERAFIEKMINK